MSDCSVVLWPTYSAELVLQGECGVASVASPNETIVLVLTPLIQTGGAGGSLDDYATAAFTLLAQSQAGTATPEFSPIAGTYDAAPEVEITCDTPDASIYYMLEGDVLPTLYTVPVTVADNTIRAIALSTLGASAVVSATYAISTTSKLLTESGDILTTETGDHISLEP